MNLKTLVYIFCLFLLCIPNFLYKITDKVLLHHILLYGFVFSTILYLTYDLVNSKREYMETKVNFEVKDTNKFAEVVGALFGYNDEPKITLNNDYGESIVVEDKTRVSPAPFGPIGPIDNVDSTMLSPKPSSEVIKKANDAYEASYRKMMDLPTEPTFKFKEDGCMANYYEQRPCCDQQGETVSMSRTCSKSKPICVNYIAEDEEWGQCIDNGGGTGNKVVVLGNYNIKPWKLKDSWTDQGAKWIWFTENAQLVSTPNSCAIFQYIYYAHEFVEIELAIACGQHCYLIIENSITRKITKIEQPPTSQQGIIHKITLEHGANSFHFHCYNTGFENKPCGLIVSCLYDNNEKILFHSDDSWTWFQGSPLMDSVIFDKSLTYEPVIALWNKKNKGFLKMNSDGTMGLIDSSNKKLNNSLDARGAIFLYQKQPVNNDIGNHTVSLYSCGHKRYVSINESNIMIGKKNVEQNVQDTSETWLPVKVTSTSCAFYNAKYAPKKYYLGTNNKEILGIDDIDLSTQWEIIYLDIIKVGTNREISNVPSFINYVYNCPLGSQIYLNDTFMTTLNNEYLYNNIYKKLHIKRTDSSFYAPWKQNLLLPGINKQYYENKMPEFEKVIDSSNIKIRQLLIHKNTYIACSQKGELCISNGSQWIVVSNSTITTYGTTGGIGGNMVLGTMNNEDVLFCVGPLIDIPNRNMKYGAIYYKPIKDILKKHTEWKLYSSQTDGSPITLFQHIVYCQKNRKLYSMVDDELCELNHNGNYMSMKRNGNKRTVKMFDIISLDYQGTMMICINNDFHIFKEILNVNTNGLGPYEMLANNIEVSKITVVNNIIFALNKSSGKIYFVPLYGGIIKEYSRTLNGNLIDIVGYNDMLYLVDNQSNVVKTHIIFE